MRENALATALHQRFLDCPQYARLLARTARAAVGELNISGLADSAKSLILSVLMHEVKRPFFLIVPDNHAGSRFQQELSNLTRYPVYFYPFSEVSPYEQVLSSPDNVAAQLEVLQKIVDAPDEPMFVLVPARALMQRVLDKETLAANNFVLSVGDTLDPKELSARLVRLGYSRETLVSLRGEFSIRGDIIDIYPSSGQPLRLELFGEEVESIRLFNIENQRSVEDAKSVLIPPRYWVILDTKKKEEFQALVTKLRAVADQTIESLGDSSAAETLRAVMENDLTSFESGSYPESTEYYAPFVHKTLTTLVDYLPAKALVLFDEWDTLIMSLTSYEEKLNASYNEGLTTGRLLPLPSLLHMSVEEVSQKLKERQRVYLSTLPIFDNENQTGLVQFDCHAIERFGNQMEVVVERIRQWRKDGHRILISTEQQQRILGLMKEWDIAATY